jgi:hypothetical protein
MLSSHGNPASLTLRIAMIPSLWIGALGNRAAIDLEVVLLEEAVRLRTERASGKLVEDKAVERSHG